MSVQFQCPCGRALIADDAHRGAEIRCPACARRLLVPAASGQTAQEPGPAQVTPEPSQGICPHCRAALPAWKTETCPGCGAFLDPARFPSPSPASIYRICPKCGGQTPAGFPSCSACGALLGPQTGTSAPAAPRPGLPWEHREALGWWKAGWMTVRLVLFKPQQAFGCMTQDDRVRNPLTFYLIFFIGPGTLVFAVAGGLLLAFWAAISPHLFKMIPPTPGFQPWKLTSAVFAMLYGAGFVVIPLFNLASLFITSGIGHLGLMLTGGARRSYATSLGCYAYAWTSTNLLQYVLCCVTWIPIVGPCISVLSFLWILAWITIAMVRAHETDTWRAIVAIWVPFLACGCACAGLQILGHGLQARGLG